MIHHRKLLLSRIGFRNTRSQKSFLFFSSVGKSILNLIETNALAVALAMQKNDGHRFSLVISVGS